MNRLSTARGGSARRLGAFLALVGLMAAASSCATGGKSEKEMVRELYDGYNKEIQAQKEAAANAKPPVSGTAPDTVREVVEDAWANGFRAGKEEGRQAGLEAGKEEGRMAAEEQALEDARGIAIKEISVLTRRIVEKFPTREDFRGFKVYISTDLLLTNSDNQGSFTYDTERKNYIIGSGLTRRIIRLPKGTPGRVNAIEIRELPKANGDKAQVRYLLEVDFGTAPFMVGNTKAPVKMPLLKFVLEKPAEEDGIYRLQLKNGDTIRIPESTPEDNPAPEAGQEPNRDDKEYKIEWEGDQSQKPYLFIWTRVGAGTTTQEDAKGQD